jgi:hypothetical protein
VPETANTSSRPPEVRLGRIHRNGIAPSLFALLDRGAGKRPGLAASLRGRVVLRFSEGYVPVRVTFGRRVIRVEDGDLRRPDLTISGRLPDIVHLTMAPLRMGVPDPADRRGRAALLNLALRRVRVAGDRRLGRGVLALMAIAEPPAPGGEIHLDPEVEARARWGGVLI